MKPTSPLSLLLFLQLTSGTRAAPIPPHSDCLHYASCDAILCQVLSELSRHAHVPPPSKPLSDPHFPKHEIANSPIHSAPHHLPPHIAEDAFDNAPVIPPETSSSSALTAKIPLESSYLLSLASLSASEQQPIPASPVETDLAAKPTSALSELRKEDDRRCWDAVMRDAKDARVASPKLGHHDHAAHMKAINCEQSESMSYDEMRGWGKDKAREYSDMLVVGIVVMFLCAVILVEAIEKLCELREAIFVSSPGAIRLKDDEPVVIVHKQFFLQPAPPPKRCRASSVENLEVISETFSDSEPVVESDTNASDVVEKV